MKQKPFIGITGVSSIIESEWLLDMAKVFSDYRMHTINTGILISEETFKGNPPKIQRYPEIDIAYKILYTLSSSFQTAIHYNSRSERPIHEQIQALFEKNYLYEKRICRYVQLNIGKPNHTELTKIKTKFPELQLIIQVPLWLEEYRNPQKISDFIREYSSCVSFFILDPSGGRGKEMGKEHEHIFQYLAEQEFSAENFVFAGGLSGKNLFSTISKIKRTFPHKNFSIDAEGKLRGGKHQGKKVGDQINPQKVKDYLTEATRVFST
jgi:hypothetical protein